MDIIKRRVQIDNNLFYEYEVSPHRAILGRISDVSASRLCDVSPPRDLSSGAVSQSANDQVVLDGRNTRTGMHILRLF
jgi:hypothetical protein